MEILWVLQGHLLQRGLLNEVCLWSLPERVGDCAQCPSAASKVYIFKSTTKRKGKLGLVFYFFSFFFYNVALVLHAFYKSVPECNTFNRFEKEF